MTYRCPDSSRYTPHSSIASSTSPFRIPFYLTQRDIELLVMDLADYAARTGNTCTSVPREWEEWGEAEGGISEEQYEEAEDSQSMKVPREPLLWLYQGGVECDDMAGREGHPPPDEFERIFKLVIGDGKKGVDKRCQEAMGPAGCERREYYSKEIATLITRALRKYMTEQCSAESSTGDTDEVIDYE